MANERLRALMLERGITPNKLAQELGVDPKTVERWVGGRVPYRRHRYAIATALHADEAYLWPGALSRDQVQAASDSEIVTVYPHRSEIRWDVWHELFSAATQEIGILVYSGLFLAEDAGVQRILAEKATAGVRVRVLLGDPDSQEVAQRSADEGAEGVVSAKIKNALVLYRPLRDVDGVEIRLHDTILYNSIYRSDDELMANTHLWGVPAAQAPVWRIRRVAGGELATAYLASFERVWDRATPVET
jgi:transcriptional regulator with XRE-family HTH domain